MNNTPIANRKTIVLVGNRNSGKSSLFNLILGQDMSIVSDYAGTTTDPVGRNMELIGYGPVRIIDTAGLDDLGDLGQMRVRKTQLEIGEADLVVHVFNAGQENRQDLLDARDRYKKLNKKAIYIFNKCDSIEDIQAYKNAVRPGQDCIFTSVKLGADHDLKDMVCKFIAENISGLEEDRGLLEGLARPGDTVVLVVPIDSEAPKGRLILPQVQMIRACLDEGVISIVVKDTELEAALDKFQDIDLVVTDSKIFDRVAGILDKSGNDIDLTSFSIVFARQKGDIDIFLDGAAYLDRLKDGDRVLIAESCTHTTSHEDIGTVLIPNLIRKKTGKDLDFEFSQGKLDETDLSRFDLMIQCGGCMMTRNNMMNRIGLAGQSGIPITNYGVVLAYLKGVFDRAIY
ncbi:[FeFe] hydrogenase H-cluster maturation GTPase HydF [Peptostreptococcus stomatis]|uniref:[FeFe] hydrogenase H-cluster maturation GTPase HydF n=1 Tax=Peptostreptococcus stomatis TaxID=341694 RepID=UPI0028D4B2BE|nr:[FeFe] hydrogenase H-cluster maturation GTPase HydF [Peptostreptococcus stomatis]